MVYGTVSALGKTIVALDDMPREELDTFISRLQGRFSYLKIGIELFYAYGRDIVTETANASGAKIFLDLKIHDIPNTASKAIKSLQGLPIAFLTIHLGGGSAMIRSCLEAQRTYLPSTALLGVSILTSLDEKDIETLWGEHFSQRQYDRLFRVALSSAIAGVVLPPNELPLLAKFRTPAGGLIKVSPGIRFADEIKTGSLGDQKRILSPEEALRKGADFIVMGRPLTKAGDRLEERIDTLKNIHKGIDWNTKE